MFMSAPRRTIPAIRKVRNGNLGSTAGVAAERRGPRKAVEKVVRRKPQVGAEPRLKTRRRRRETRRTVTLQLPFPAKEELSRKEDQEIRRR
jgi:hypothetical protein